ncbi:MAG: transposase [Candidatus Humimicrobiaceae bacterium]
MPATTPFYPDCWIKRFSSKEKLCSYAGLVPSTHQSGDRCYQGQVWKILSLNIILIFLVQNLTLY